MTFKSRQHERAYRAGESSVGRDIDNPYDGIPGQEELADLWSDGRNAAEVEAGEEYADYCDPSMRDCYE